ncbi:sorting nexin-10A [Archocentrus centrarchus]|uniref:sorting nexin-10A n=1 Tax=Archocentrus centrarchus TaxID=63155 RepID=UPI0011E9FA03|nr:sorting nexin-10A-like [Archocentrus centrarchus]
MDTILDSFSDTEFIRVCVRDPRLHKDDLWHTHVDYEISLHTNCMCFRKKTSSVRRRYSEFVWLRHCLEQNAFIIELPKLPPWNPFFSLKNTEQVIQRMKGLQKFLEIVLHTPLLLSDSRLHLFLQSDLTITKIEKCALGKTRYTVAEAIQHSRGSNISRSEEKISSDSDCESTSSSGLGVSLDTPGKGSPLFFQSPDGDPESFGCSENTSPLMEY